ncbi:MAG: aldolase catalytic domain-containing protein [Elusimicrobiota bacterium]|jgi:4-hydroxy 2-oxovalerate aldolase|nr:aldolase catalytic domain-containing protein [Elusimicrobiota bacterium]
MNNIKILDCTLRDGGYINNWNFGENCIKKIIYKLSQSNVDIIECGFLSEKMLDNADEKSSTLFRDIKNINNFIINKNENSMYVAMIAYPDKIIEKIPKHNKNFINGIRVTFHEKEIDEALKVCEKLDNKGYKVFIQPVGIVSYDDINIINLIKKVNKINPYAFYIVDTLGSMYKNDLMRLFYLIDNNLNKNIYIGFHSHNNLQLSFSNAIGLMSLQTKRIIIIDSSVFGMGRGAGNLCTELLAQYINKYIIEKYNINELLEIIDEYLINIYAKNVWGYSVPYCLSAINDCHPNYANYLIEKQTITIKQICNILQKIDFNKKTIFDKGYIEKIYLDYQKKVVDDTKSLEKIKNIIGNKKVLLLAPGKSINTEKNKINKIIKKENLFVISINFSFDEIKSDMNFISNLKRVDEFIAVTDIFEKGNNIITSNIITVGNDKNIIINYADLVTENPLIIDNAGLMLIKLLIKIGIKEIYCAGFDGYIINQDNYFESKMELIKSKDNITKTNEAIKKYLKKLSYNIKINFITKSIYNE